MKKRICLIGGANIDICATPFNMLINNDSNPGKITYSLGGVARNVAENLALVDVEVELITVFGNDSWAEVIKKNLNERGIMYSCSIESQSNSSVYLYITDNQGEMQLAVNDMKVLEQLNFEFIKSKIEYINTFDGCFIDTNLTKETLSYIMNNAVCPLFIDAVSVNKVFKLKGVLKNIEIFKPNLIEAEELSGKSINNGDSIDDIANGIIELGVKNLFISLGSQGVYYSNGVVSGKKDSLVKSFVNTNGAGDSMMAGLISAYFDDKDIEEMAERGLIMAAMCIESLDTVNKNITKNSVIVD